MLLSDFQVWVLQGHREESSFASLILTFFQLQRGKIYSSRDHSYNHMFSEHPLCAGHCSGHWGWSNETADTVLVVKGLTSSEQMGNDQMTSDSNQ